MTPKDAASRIEITVFASEAQTEESTTALVDNSLPVSLIARGLVHRLNVRYEEYRQSPVEDSQKELHNPQGHVELYLHRSDVPKSRLETFYIVDSVKTVVLRTAAVPEKEESNVLTLGLEPQTEGMTNWILYANRYNNEFVHLVFELMVVDQKRQQELKRQDAQSRRIEEKKIQEERERQKRQQVSQAQ